jgi:hypothetical protein
VLRDHYAERDRPEVANGLNRGHGIKIVPTRPEGLRRHVLSPRRHAGRAWIKAGPYWIAYRPSLPVIVAVFYETANMHQSTIHKSRRPIRSARGVQVIVQAILEVRSSVNYS